MENEIKEGEKVNVFSPSKKAKAKIDSKRAREPEKKRRRKKTRVK